MLIVPPIDDCRGQGYNGAGNMAGQLSGAAAGIQAVQNMAIYVHCNSHILNLYVGLLLQRTAC